MILEVPAYKHISNNQEIDFTNRKICTLIGENGSGKSTILESVFNSNDEYNIISFSSGQNELFSKIYKNVKNDTFKKIQEIDRTLENIKKYHFDLEFSRILIFLASTFKNGNTRKYLISKDYIENVNDLKIGIDFELPTYYIKAYKEAIENESLDYEYTSVRNTYIHTYLEKIIETKIDNEFDFDKVLTKRTLEFTNSEILNIFPEKDAFKAFTFISLTNNASKSIFNYKTSKLFFKELEFESLSDGEFQLLSIYALIDLFDDVNTIFLLDEIDSHLHFMNIGKLWDCLNTVNGKVLTTTHILDSIVQNKINSLKIIEDTKILDEVVIENILSRIDNISSNKSYKYKLASKVEYIALVENTSDWFIFEELLKQKKPDYDSSLFKKVHPINCSSGYENKSNDFGKSRIQWFNEFKTIVNRSENKLKEIFMICDKDELHCNRINNNMSVKSDSFLTESLKKFDGKTFPRLLSWKRREIENYFISKTMLEHYGKKDEIENLLPRNINLEDNSMDIDVIQELEVKDIIKSLFSNVSGNDYEKIKEVIARIPPEEISEDIVKMYKFLKSKI